MIINYLAVVSSAILAMAVGFVWYGPLFGKTWLKITGMSSMSEEQQKRMKKDSNKLYAIQFALTLFQVWVLARSFTGVSDAPQNMVWIWAAIVIPTLASAVMFTGDSTKVKWAKFLVQGGYQLVIFVLFGLILGMWK